MTSTDMLAKLRTRLTLSILDQAVLSGFGFILNLLLIRVWRPELFGMYSVVTGVALVGFGIQNALAGAQMVVLRPRARDPEDEAELLTCLWTASCAVMLATVAATMAGVALAWRDLWPAFPLASSLLVGSMLLRESVRNVLFSELRISAVFMVDFLFISIATAGIVLLLRYRDELDIVSICFVMGLANAIASTPALMIAGTGLAIRVDRVSWARYRAIWRAQARWALLGVAGYEIMSRAHIFIVGAFFGTAAVGILQAGLFLFRPLNLILQAWGRVAQPTFAKLAVAGDRKASQWMLHLSAGAAILMSGLFMTGLWAAWPILENYVFKADYPNMGTVVLFWGVATAVRLVTGVYSAQVEALARFRELSLAEIVGAAIALLALGVAVASGQYRFSILATIAGYLAELVLVLAIVSQALPPPTGIAKPLRAAFPWFGSGGR